MAKFQDEKDLSKHNQEKMTRKLQKDIHMELDKAYMKSCIGLNDSFIELGNAAVLQYPPITMHLNPGII